MSVSDDITATTVGDDVRGAVEVSTYLTHFDKLLVVSGRDHQVAVFGFEALKHKHTRNELVRKYGSQKKMEGGRAPHLVRDDTFVGRPPAPGLLPAVQEVGSNVAEARHLPDTSTKTPQPSPTNPIGKIRETGMNEALCCGATHHARGDGPSHDFMTANRKRWREQSRSYCFEDVDTNGLVCVCTGSRFKRVLARKQKNKRRKRPAACQRTGRDTTCETKPPL